MNRFQANIYSIYTAIATIGCSATTSSGGTGVTEFIIALDKPLGGIVIMDFNAQGVVDKLEILHNGVKKATSGMTVANAGPFDDLYGNPTVPTSAEATATDQFIGTAKGTVPTRDAAFLSDTNITDVTRLKQQLIWFVYTSGDYNLANSVIIRITGPGGTAWDLGRLCTNQTPTSTAPAPAPTLEAGSISSTSQAAPENGCAMLTDSTCYIDTATNGAITSGDKVYHDAAGTNPIAGGNQYYKISLINKHVVLIDGLGVISVHSICA